MQGHMIKEETIVKAIYDGIKAEEAYFFKHYSSDSTQQEILDQVQVHGTDPDSQSAEEATVYAIHCYIQLLDTLNITAVYRDKEFEATALLWNTQFGTS